MYIRQTVQLAVIETKQMVVDTTRISNVEVEVDTPDQSGDDIDPLGPFLRSIHG
jgi:hypothetical protein